MPTSISYAADVQSEIFELLKRSGPLCASQIAVKLGRPLKSVRPVLDELRTAGLVEPRPDRDPEINYDEDEKPWGLSRPRFARRSN